MAKGIIIRTLTGLPKMFLKMLYLLPFFVFGGWLLQQVYFPQIRIQESIAKLQSHEEEDIFKAIMNRQESVPRGHFHMVDTYVTAPEHGGPLCASCHGTYPHSKEKKVRALLNFHSGFIACAVCHARKTEMDPNMEFAWVDRESGDIVPRAEGEYGKYSAKIYPVRLDAGEKPVVIHPVSLSSAKQFLKYKHLYSPDQVAQAKIKLHEKISTHPVFCSDCHQKDGYLDFRGLGFSPQRIQHLNSTEVVGMIEKYKTFYLPSEIDFGIEKGQ